MLFTESIYKGQTTVELNIFKMWRVLFHARDSIVRLAAGISFPACCQTKAALSSWNITYILYFRIDIQELTINIHQNKLLLAIVYLVDFQGPMRDPRRLVWSHMRLYKSRGWESLLWRIVYPMVTLFGDIDSIFAKAWILSQLEVVSNTECASTISYYLI